MIRAVRRNEKTKGTVPIYGALARRIGTVPGQINKLHTCLQSKRDSRRNINIATGKRVIINELIGYIDNLPAISLIPTYAENPELEMLNIP